MCGVVLEVLNLDADNCPGRGPVVIVLRVFDGEQVGGERGVERVGQQHELERDLLLQFNRNCIGFLKYSYFSDQESILYWIV